MSIQKLKNELLKNKEFKKVYLGYDLAFEIGQTIAEARLIKGITQEKLAKLVKTKQSGIARAERGNRLPSLSFLNRVAQALKTNLIVKFEFMSQTKTISNDSLTDTHSFESMGFKENEFNRMVLPVHYSLKSESRFLSFNNCLQNL
jgi:transcriptional regulator with XRE-family HTH domain